MSSQHSLQVILKDFQSISQNMDKLTSAINVLNNEIHKQISTNYKTYISHIALNNTLEVIFLNMLEKMQNLLNIIDKLRYEINHRYLKLAKTVSTLDKLHTTSDKLRKYIQSRKLNNTVN